MFYLLISIIIVLLGILTEVWLNSRQIIRELKAAQQKSTQVSFEAGVREGLDQARRTQHVYRPAYKHKI